MPSGFKQTRLPENLFGGQVLLLKQESVVSSQESVDFWLAIGFCIIVTTTWLKICRLVFGFAFFVEIAADPARLYLPPIRKSAC